MRRMLAGLPGLLLCATAAAWQPAVADNTQIDAQGFLEHVRAAGVLRQSRRVSEADFLRLAREPNTVLLDARSERLYRLRHVKGAVNLSFPEFTQATLARVVPSKQTRILIYCNNNFVGAPDSLPLKNAASALNLSTFISLHAYGYRNVYELGPLIDVKRSKLAFAGEEVR